jgi:uncharacterized protein (TIGR01777 family)
MRVFVTGGTGLIGTRLVKQLLGRGDQVVLLTRRYAFARQRFGTACDLVEGDPMQAGEWGNAIADCDAVVNLAGENVFNRRWRATFKALLAESRINSARNVVEALTRQPRRADGRPKVLVNASAIGYYGPHDNEDLTEDSPPSDDFLARLCVDWEKTALAVQTAGVRCALVRVGIVLDKEGGALAKLLTPFKLCLGGKVAGGRQWMSWIHHADMTGLFLLVLDNEQAGGPLNGTAPNPVTNTAFAHALGRALHRPAIFPTPGFVLRAVLGEVAGVVTTGQRALPKRALGLGYSFQFPHLDAALADLVGG